MSVNSLNGKCTIRVRFHSKPEYDKFRIYILKTDWKLDIGYPEWEEYVHPIRSYEDVEGLVKHIFFLITYGFEVQWCRFQPEEELASEEHPTEEDPEVDELGSPEEYDIQKMCDDLWRIAGRKE